MAKILLYTVFIVLFQYAFSQDTVESKSDSSRDPVSLLLKELGLIVLDVDEAYSRFTAPKVEFEDGVKERMYGRPRSEYFNRIRENYRKIQRIGSRGSNDLSFSSNMFGVKVKNDGQASFVGVSIPTLPLKLQVRSKIPTVEESDSKGSDNAGRFTEKEPESRFASKIKVGNSEIKLDSAFPLTDTLSSIVQTGRSQEFKSEVSDNAEGLIPKAPKSRLASKINVGNSEIKLDSAFERLDDSAETQITRRVLETGSGEFDSAEEFTTKNPESRLASKIHVGDSQIKAEIEPQAKISEVAQDELYSGLLIELGDSDDGEKRTKRTSQMKIADEELMSLFTKIYNEYLLSNTWADDFKPSDIYTGPRGRMFGDLLYSESTFDKLTKEAVQNSLWVLDSDLSPYKVFKNIEDFMKSVFPRQNRESKALPEPSNFKSNSDIGESAKESRLPRNAAEFQTLSGPAKPGSPVSDGGSSSYKVGTQPSNTDQMETEASKETILLAFARNGVPVKLRIGPEIKRPYRFLHAILSSARVTLCVPVRNADADLAEKEADLAEKEADLAEKEADLAKKEADLPIPPLFVNLSNRKERYAFLRTLRKFKISRSFETVEEVIEMLRN